MTIIVATAIRAQMKRCTKQHEGLWGYKVDTLADYRDLTGGGIGPRNGLQIA